MQLLTNRARAYVYNGDWVADCPRPCGNAEHLFDLQNPRDPTSPRTVRKTSFHCTYCQLMAEIEWAPDEDRIREVLHRRPIPHTRNWYPAGHTTALMYGLADGQSVAQLEDENREHGVS